MKNESFNEKSKEELKIFLREDVLRRELLVEQRISGENSEEEISPEALPSFRLEEGILKNIKKIEEGVNDTYFVEFTNCECGIFKPSEGEKREEYITDGSCYKRERAAYLVSLFFGFDIVPPTVIREIEGKIGSVQSFVPSTAEYHEVCEGNNHKQENVLFQNQLKTLWVFDLLIHSSDRNLYNILCTENEDNIFLHAIDNGYSFNGLDFRFEGGEYFDQYLPDELIEKLEHFNEDTRLQEILRQQLSELLPESEISAFFSRVEKISAIVEENGKIPLSEKENISLRR